MTICRSCQIVSRPALYQFLICGMICCFAIGVRAQQNVEVGHLSSLNLFTGGDLDASNAHKLARAIQQLNDLRGDPNGPVLVVVTGTVGAGQLLRAGPNQGGRCAPAELSDPVRSRISQSAGELALLLQRSKISNWLFLPGRGDRIIGCGNELAIFHDFLAEVGRQSEILHGPTVVDLSQNSSFLVGDVLVLGMDTSGFVGLPGIAGLTGFRDAFQKSPQPHVLIAESWPRVGNPFPTAKSGVRDSSPLAEEWPLTPDQRQIWLDVITSDRVSAILAGDWQIPDRSLYTDFHSLFPPNLSSADITKLYVSPPLGAPKQSSVPEAPATGFEIIRLDHAGRVVRLLYWSAGDGFETETSLAFSRQLEIGDAYDHSGQAAQAEAAYRKAVDLASDSDRKIALDRLERVLQSWGFYEIWVKYRRWLALIAILISAIVIFWLIWRRERRLQIYPLDAPTEAKIAAAHLEQVGQYLVGLMRYYAAKAGPIGTTKLPFIWSGFSPDLGPLLQQLVPAKASGIVSWLPAWLFRPEFTLKGTVATSSTDAYIVLTLSRHGTAVRSWEQSTRLDQLHDTLKDLVYAVLLHINGYSA
jgi:hypothetical protein